MTWVWLLVWNASWLLFALLYVKLETKPGAAASLQKGSSGYLERRHEEAPRNPGKRTRRHRR
jgi:hypothetical protein